MISGDRVIRLYSGCGAGFPFKAAWLISVDLSITVTLSAYFQASVSELTSCQRPIPTCRSTLQTLI